MSHPRNPAIKMKNLENWAVLSPLSKMEIMLSLEREVHKETKKQCHELLGEPPTPESEIPSNNGLSDEDLENKYNKYNRPQETPSGEEEALSESAGERFSVSSLGSESEELDSDDEIYEVLPVHSEVDVHEIVEAIPNSQEPSTSYCSELLLGKSPVSLKLGALAFLGMLTHDLVNYYLYPNQRFGITIPDILVGQTYTRPTEFGYTRGNDNFILSDMGSDDPKDYIVFWAGILAWFFIPALEILVKSKFNLKAVPRANENKSSFERFATNRIVTNICKLFVVYQYLYLSGIFSQKIAQSIVLEKNTIACHDQNKEMTYVPEIGDYYCSIGGGWSDLQIPFYDLNNPQACMDKLLSKNSSPEKMIDRLDSLKPFANDIHQLGFKDQAWVSWSDASFENILNQISHFNFNTTNLNVDFYNNEIDNKISSSKIQSIIEFVQQTNPASFGATNLDMGDYKSKFVDGFNNTTMSRISFNRVGLGDDGLISFSKVTPSMSKLEEVNVVDDTVTSNGIQVFASTLPAQVQVFNFNKNKLLTSNLPIRSNTNFRSVGFSYIQDDAEDVAGLNSWICQDVVNDVDLSFATILPVHLEKLCVGVNTETLNLNGLALDDLESVEDFFSNLPKGIKKLLLAQTRLAEGCGKVIRDYFLRSGLDEVSISGNSFSISDFNFIIDGAFNARIPKIDLSSLDLDNQYAQVLANYLLLGWDLEKLILSSNQISSLKEIFLSATKTRIAELDVSKNPSMLEECADLQTMISSFSSETLSIGSKLCDGDQLPALLESFNNSTLSYFTIDGATLSRENVIDISKTLVSSKNSLSYLDKDVLNKAERRDLHDSQSASKQKSICFLNAKIAPNDKALLDRLTVVQNIPQIQFDNCVFNNQLAANFADTGSFDVLHKILASLPILFVVLYASFRLAKRCSSLPFFSRGNHSPNPADPPPASEISDNSLNNFSKV